MTQIFHVSCIIKQVTMDTGRLVTVRLLLVVDVAVAVVVGVVSSICTISQIENGLSLREMLVLLVRKLVLAGINV